MLEVNVNIFQITSILGNILCWNSTNKLTKKLAGHGKGAGQWVTNVGDEHRQILMSVLTWGGGSHLDQMMDGIIARYRTHGASPPEIMYVDQDCCRQNSQRLVTLPKQDHAWVHCCFTQMGHRRRRGSSACGTDPQNCRPCGGWPQRLLTISFVTIILRGSP